LLSDDLTGGPAVATTGTGLSSCHVLYRRAVVAPLGDCSMSKIFDAYRKRMGETPDFVAEVRRAGTVALYPAPTARQLKDFNRLANRILGLGSRGRGNVLAFASSASGEGASFVSYSTAVHLAEAFGQQVVWLDGNFLSPQTRLPADGLTFATLLQQPGAARELQAATNPLLIAAGSDLQRYKGLLAGPNYIELLRLLGERYDFVFVDLPPILESPDATLMAAGTSGCLLVIEQRHLKRELIQHGLDHMQNKGVRVLGSVINRRTYDLPKVIYERL
jgi:Mrp family chromosome partitioning ATPase